MFLYYLRISAVTVACVCVFAVSYTHLDVYKRQALIFTYLRPEQTNLGLIREDDDDEHYM